MKPILMASEAMYIFLLVMNSIQVSPSLASEKQLIDHLLKHHYKDTRPVVNKSWPVTVNVGIELIQMMSINERQQHITNKLWMRIYWTNELMTWKPNMWDDIKSSKIDSTLVWTPDLILYDNVAEDISAGTEKHKTRIMISHDGKHAWLTPVLFTSSCSIDVKNFPFDQQTCTLKFGSWTMDQSEMDIALDPRPIVTSNYVNSSEWELLSANGKVTSMKYGCCKNPYVDISYTFKLKRKPAYYVTNVIIPCLILMIITMFSFFLPPDSGERITVVITVLLTFAVFQQMLSATLPRNSNSTPMLSIFYITVMAESACSLISTSLVLVIHYRGMEKGVIPLPQWIRKYFLNSSLNKKIGIPQNLREYSFDELRVLQSRSGIDNKACNGVVDNSTHAQKVPTTPKSDAVVNRKLHNVANGVVAHDVTKNVANNVADNSANGVTADKVALQAGNSVHFQESIDGLLHQVSIITSLIHDQNRQDEIEEEWQVFGKVLDRIFFLVFLLIFTISCTAILLPVYLPSTED